MRSSLEQSCPPYVLGPERPHQQVLSQVADTLAQLHPNSLTHHCGQFFIET